MTLVCSRHAAADGRYDHTISGLLKHLNEAVFTHWFTVLVVRLLVSPGEPCLKGKTRDPRWLTGIGRCLLKYSCLSHLCWHYISCWQTGFLSCCVLGPSEVTSLFILAVQLSRLMTAFCSYPSELALCSPQRTHSPAPGLCLWHLWLPWAWAWAWAWFMSSVSLETQSGGVHCLLGPSTSHPVISQLVWLSRPSWLTLFCSMFPGLHPSNH